MRIQASDYDGIAYREIRYKLRTKGVPEHDIEQHILDIRAARHARSNDKRKLKEHNKRWAEIIAALQNERRIVRGMLRYKTKTPTPERDEFVEQYYAALNRVYAQLLARKNRGEGEPPVKTLPEHEHWTDFVPNKVKRSFQQAATEIPQRDKSKFKDPFQRTSPAALSDLRRGRLLRYIRATLNTLLSRIDDNPDDPKLIRKEGLLREAIKRVNTMPATAHIPNHWADVVRDLLREGDDTDMTTKTVYKPSKKRRATVKDKPDEKPAPPPTATQKRIQGSWQSERRRIQALAEQPIQTTVAKMLDLVGGTPGDTPRITED